jgi:photosystem II stability/assembly factor-like uncharacterized protein
MKWAVVVLAAVLLLAGCASKTRSSTWHQVPDFGFSSFSFSDAAHGWAVDSLSAGLLATDDGGGSWYSSHGRIVGAPSQGVGALPATIDRLPLPDLVLCLGQRIFLTHLAQAPTGSVDSPPATASGGVLVSDDRGATWRSCLSLAPGKDSVLGLVASDGNHLWALCGAGKPDPSVKIYLLRSSDGGRSWQRLPKNNLAIAGIDTPSPLTFVDARHGWSSLDRYSNGAETSYRTTIDGGRSWSRISTPPNAGSVLFALDAQRAWAGSGWMSEQLAPGGVISLYSTVDGGRSWQADHAFDRLPVMAVYFVDARHGWVFVGAPPLNGAIPKESGIYATSDGGRHWARELSSNDPNWGGQELDWTFCRAGNTLFAGNRSLCFSRSLTNLGT